MENGYFASAVEAIILASPEPIAGKKIAGVLDEATPSRVSQAVASLNERYAETGSSFRIREIAGGYQYYVLPEYVGFVEELFARRRKLRLTRAALETVAIIAYRQPVTKTDIEHIRGVNSDGVLHNLMEKNMITIVGRAESVGKPLQYGTTDEFLKFFGLNQLTDLPKMSEIEELIRASDEQKQTELILEEREDGSIKLNIADGTFDPASRNRDDESDDDMSDVAGEEEESQAGTDSEHQEPAREDAATGELEDLSPTEPNGSDEKTVSGRLVLKQTTPDVRHSEDSVAEDHEQEVTVDESGEAEADR